MRDGRPDPEELRRADPEEQMEETLQLRGTHVMGLWSKLPLVVALVLWLGPVPVCADFFAPSHSCPKPHKPYQFNSRSELNSYLDDVDRYKRCIGEFVSDQRRQAAGHYKAANEAIEEWNHFVNYEMK